MERYYVRTSTTYVLKGHVPAQKNFFCGRRFVILAISPQSCWDRLMPTPFPFRVDENWFCEVVRSIKNVHSPEEIADLVIQATLLGVRDGLVELQ